MGPEAGSAVLRAAAFQGGRVEPIDGDARGRGKRGVEAGAGSDDISLQLDRQLVDAAPPSTASPKERATTLSAMSIPAEMPAEVSRVPSSTK